jgi:type II secretory pathway pseudopilin PulG
MKRDLKVLSRRKRSSQKRFPGFTLPEILLAVGVIVAIAAISFSVFSSSRKSTQRIQCDVHLKALGLALDAFRQERGSFPATLDELRTEGYITDKSIFYCPSDPRPKPSYQEYYVVRGPRDKQELPILVCPFHENTSHGNQAFVGRYTTQAEVAPAGLEASAGATVQHPGKDPVAAPVGMALHGADRIRTGSGGFATIRFKDGSKALIGKNADVTVLQSFIQGQGSLYTIVRQNSGTAKYEVHHGSKFDVVTPTTTAGALGTKFEIRVSATAGTWLKVTEGKVRFTTLASSEITVTEDDDQWYSVPPAPADTGNGPPPGERPRPEPGQGPPPPA